MTFQEYQVVLNHPVYISIYMYIYILASRPIWLISSGRISTIDNISARYESKVDMIE